MLDSVLQSTTTLVSPAFDSAFNQLLTDAIQVALLGLVAIMVYVAKLGISHLKFSLQQKIALKLVRYANQKFLVNEQRLSYVKSKLKKLFPRIDEEELDHAVEAAVVELKSSLTLE